jgi:predicted RNA-binding protein YlxR (DUF448 family)
MVKRRPGHIPERTCVACRTRRPKRELIAFSKRPDGSVAVGWGGRSEGRSAYACPDERCLTIAVKKLGHALRCEPATMEKSEQQVLLDKALQLTQSGDTARHEEN